MRPLFSRRTRGKEAAGSEEPREKSDSPGRSDQNLNLHKSGSIPSESQRFAHLGVLADVEHAQKVAPEEW